MDIFSHDCIKKLYEKIILTNQLICSNSRVIIIFIRRNITTREIEL